MKKTLAILLATAMLAGSFAGCGSPAASSAAPAPADSSNAAAPADPAAPAPESKSGEPVTLTYWQHSSAARDEMMTKLVADFEKQNPNIKIKLEFIPEKDYTQKLVPSLATATAPDVFQVQAGMASKLAAAGSIQALDPSVISYDKVAAEFVPATVDGLKVDGKYYGMPTDVQTVLTFWNKKLVAEAGLDAEKGPQTWDEFYDWARKLTKKDDKGNLMQSGWGGKGYHAEVQSYVEACGGKFYDPATKQFEFANDPKSVEAVRKYASLYKDDKVYNTEFVANWAGFRQGVVAMMIGHPAMLGNLPTTAPDLDFAVALLPTQDGKRPACTSSWAYVMSNKAPSAEATKFIEFLSSEAVEKEWTLKTGELPARKSLLSDADLLKDAKASIAIKSLDESFTGIFQTPSLNTLLKEMFDEIYKTDKPLEEILKTYQQKMTDDINAPV